MGPGSPFAGWFDIDWNAPHPGLAGKVLVPFLGDAYGDALDAGGWRCASTRPRAASRSGPTAPTSCRSARALRRDPGARRRRTSTRPACRRPRPTLRRALKAAPRRHRRPDEAALAAAASHPDARARLDALIARQHWRAGEVRPRPRRHQLPPLLRHQRPRRRPRRGPGGLRGHPRPDPRASSTKASSTASASTTSTACATPRPTRCASAHAPPGRSRSWSRRSSRPTSACRADWQIDGTTGYEFANLARWASSSTPPATDALTADLRRLHRPAHAAPPRWSTPPSAPS